jgi:hypothetical protein
MDNDQNKKSRFSKEKLGVFIRQATKPFYSMGLFLLQNKATNIKSFAKK